MTRPRRPHVERILGIDPGTAATGFAVIDRVGADLQPVWYDCLRTSTADRPADRLLRIGRSVQDVLEHLRPDVAAVEELFFGANARTALAVGQARGVCMYACANAGVQVHEYSPSVVKGAVTGYGQADKQQVQRMVQQLLKLTVLPRPDHCADAFAVAICHAASMRMPAATR